MYIKLYIMGSGALCAYIVALALLSSLHVDGFLHLPHAALNYRIKSPASREVISKSIRSVDQLSSGRPLFFAPAYMDQKLDTKEEDEVVDTIDAEQQSQETSKKWFEVDEKDIAQFKTIESKFYGVVAKGVVPLSTSLGFTLVPSTNMVLRLAGAAAGGLAGLVPRSSLLKLAEKSKELGVPERPPTDVAQLSVYDQVLNGVDQRNIALQRLTEGIIPAAIFAGFAAVPSNHIALRLLGAVVGWVGGAATEKYADVLLTRDAKDRYHTDVAVSEVPETVQKALTALHRVPTPWTELTCADLCTIARKHHVHPRHVDVFLSLAVAEVIFAAVQVDDMDLYRNLAGVLHFASSGGIPYAAVAHGLAFAGLKVCDQLEPCTDGTAVYTDEFDPEVLAQAAKVLFLSEHLLSKEKGYLEGKLVPALAAFPPEMYKLYLTADATALFEEVCRLAFVAPEEYTEETVPAYMEFLTVSPEVSGFELSDMHATIRKAVQVELHDNIPETSPPLEVNFKDFHRFEQGCKALGIVGKDFNYTVIRHTQGIFDDAAQTLMKIVANRPEQALQLQAKLLERMVSLKIDLYSAGQTMHRLAEVHNEAFQDRIAGVYRAADEGMKEAAASRALAAYAHIFDAMQQLAAPFIGDKPLVPPELPFDEKDRFKILLAKTEMAGAKMTVSEVERTMLDLPDDAGKFVHETLAIPKTGDFLLKCIRADQFNPDAKKMYLSMLAECGVSAEVKQATALDVFYNETEKVAVRAVPTQEEMDRLDRMRDFLDLSEESVQDIYIANLGNKYSKAVAESLAPENTMSMEYAYGLQRLRKRLKLGFYEAAILLFSDEVVERFTPVIKGLIDAWKSETDGSYQRQNAHEPPKVFMREVMNMLDLYQQAFRLLDCEGGVPAELRITAEGLATEEEMAELYKHFLLHRISEEDPELRQRYMDRTLELATLLGISPEDQDHIRRELAFTTYARLLTGALRTQDTVDRALMQQFAFLKYGLQLTDHEAEIIYAEATTKAISDNAEEIMEAINKGERPAAPSCRRIRQQVGSLTGLQATQHLYLFDFHLWQLIRLFLGCVAGHDF